MMRCWVVSRQPCQLATPMGTVISTTYILMVHDHSLSGIAQANRCSTAELTSRYVWPHCSNQVRMSGPMVEAMIKVLSQSLSLLAYWPVNRLDSSVWREPPASLPMIYRSLRHLSIWGISTSRRLVMLPRKVWSSSQLMRTMACWSSRRRSATPFLPTASC